MCRISFLPVLLTALLLGAGPVVAQQAAIRLAPQPDIAPHVGALPRIIAPRGPQTDRINRALAAADARVLDSAQQCRSQLQQSGHVVDPEAEWQRSVSVAMQGPRYLAFVLADSWDCGAAYPSVAQFPLAYDLRTGAPLNWQKLLPRTLAAQATLDTAGDGTRLGVIASPALTALYLQEAGARIAQVDAGCTAALHDTSMEFVLWPDAQRDGVALQPSNLPHVMAACGVDAVLPLATLRRLGAAPDLLDAIAAAHAAAAGPGGKS